MIKKYAIRIKYVSLIFNEETNQILWKYWWYLKKKEQSS